MSRDIDLIKSISATQGVDVVITALDSLHKGSSDAGHIPGKLPYGAARLIVVGPPADDETLVTAATVGAWAYCPLDSPPQELTATVRRVHAGECPLLVDISRRPAAARAVIDILAMNRRTPVAGNLLPNPLSERDREILNAIIDGKSGREIAEIVGLTDQTVRNYMTALLQKIGARTRSQAAALALRNGWLDA